MCQESKPIPLTDTTQEVAVRITDGRAEIVLVDFEGRREVVPVVLRPVAPAPCACGRVAA